MNPEPPTGQRVIWDTECDIVGPMLFGFVHWCLAQAAERGLRQAGQFSAAAPRVRARTAVEQFMGK